MALSSGEPMTMSTPDIVSQDTPDVVGSNATSIAMGSKAFPESQFLTGTGGIRKDENGNKIPGSREVQFSGELRGEFESVLEYYVSNIYHADFVAKLPADERKLFKLIANEDGTLNKGAVDKLLQSHEGWTSVAMLVEQQATIANYAVGLEIQRAPAAVRQVLAAVGEMTIEPGVNMKEQIRQEIAKKFPKADATLLNHPLLRTITYLPMNHPLVRGGMKVRDIYNTFQDLKGRATTDVVLKTTTSPAALLSIQSDPTLAEYVKVVTGGIDVNDYEFVVPTGGTAATELTLKAKVASTRNIERLTQQAVGLSLTRRKFFIEAHVPADRVDANAEQFLQGTTSDLRPEGTDMRYQQRVLDLFNEGGYDPTTNTEEANRSRYMQVRQKAMGEYLSKALKAATAKEAAGVVNATPIGSIELIDAQAERIRSGGAKTADLESRRAELTQQQTAAQAYEVAQNQTQGLFEQLESEYPGVIKSTADIDVVINNIANSPTLQFSLIRIDADLATVLAKKDKFIKDEDDANRRAHTSKTSIDTVKSDNARVRERAEALYGQEIQALRDKRAASEARIARLTTARDEIAAGQRELILKRDEILGTVRIDPKDIDLAYDALLMKSTGIGLTASELSNDSIDNLIKRINQINATNPTFGWQESENNNPVNRALLRNAMTEARARTREVFDPQRIEGQKALSALLKFKKVNIDIRYLANTPTAQVRALFAGAGITSVTPDMIRNATEWAQILYVNRAAINVDLEVHDIDSLKGQVEKVNEVTIEQLNAIKRVLRHQEAAIVQADQVITDVSEYTKDALIDPDQVGFTPAEREAYVDKFGTTQLPEGVFEWYQLLSNYQTDTENPDRDKNFRELVAMLPPRTLAQTIDEKLKLGVLASATGVPDTGTYLVSVFKELAAQVDNQDISEQDVRRVLVDLYKAIDRSRVTVASS